MHTHAETAGQHRKAVVGVLPVEACTQGRTDSCKVQASHQRGDAQMPPGCQMLAICLCQTLPHILCCPACAVHCVPGNGLQQPSLLALFPLYSPHHTFLMLVHTRRPSLTAATMLAKLSSTSTILLASLDTSVPARRHGTAAACADQHEHAISLMLVASMLPHDLVCNNCTRKHAPAVQAGAQRAHL